MISPSVWNYKELLNKKNCYMAIWEERKGRIWKVGETLWIYDLPIRTRKMGETGAIFSLKGEGNTEKEGLLCMRICDNIVEIAAVLWEPGAFSLWFISLEQVLMAKSCLLRGWDLSNLTWAPLFFLIFPFQSFWKLLSSSIPQSISSCLLVFTHTV